MATGKAKKVIVPQADEALMPVSMEDVQDKIIVLRGEPVILDRDLAKLYGVETREINQALKNNPRKFPAGYTFILDNQDIAEMRSKILITSSGDTENEQVKPIFSKNMATAETETELELNFAVLKLKHTIKRKKK